MKKYLALCAAVLLAVLSIASPAGAQDDPVQGTVAADPAFVPAAGEYTITATGSGFIPDSNILLGACQSPGDTLVFGVSTDEDIVAAGQSIDPLQHCDLATAANVAVDGDGNFSAEWTGEVGDNFWFSAGALDGSQAGGVWVPIVDADAAAQLAVTGVGSWFYALMGFAAIALGIGAVEASKRFATA